jgi:threonine dehydrogenase-like Zn-dependent dehydrogenase
LRLVKEGQLDASSLITHRFCLEQFQRAFLVMHSKARHKAVKAIFDFEQE